MLTISYISVICGGAQAPLKQQQNQASQNNAAKLNEIGKHFEQFPGYQFAVQEALKIPGVTYSMATNIAKKEYYNWLKIAVALEADIA